MAPRGLTPEQRAIRDAEKAEQLATRKKYKKVTIQPENMENEKPTPTPTETDPKTASPVHDTTIKTDPAPASDNSSGLKSDDNFSPLGGNKIKRGYSAPVINQNLQNVEIPEPTIITENLSAEKSAEIIKQGQSTASALDGKSNPAPNPVLPPAEGFNQLSPNEQKEAAAMTADLILGAYDRLHWLGRKFVSVDMDDLADEHRKGEINMNLEAFENEDDPEKGITIKEYFEDFNTQVEEEFVVTPEFKEAVRPPLERICQKRGWGASDEMFLAFKFCEDIAMKTGILIGFKKLTNKYMQEFRDDHSRIQKAQQVAVQKERDRVAAQKAIQEEAIAKVAAEKAAKEALAKEEKENKDVKTGA